MNKRLLLLISCSLFLSCAMAQQKAKPEDTEVYSPVPKTVDPGKPCGGVPSDAIVLFDGSNANQWISTKDTTKPAGWKVQDGVLTVNKPAGDIQTKNSFLDY